MFKKARAAFEKMESDSTVRVLRNMIRIAQAKLEAAEAPYREIMTAAEVEMTDHILKTEQTVVFLDIEGKYSGGRKSTSWKSIANEINKGKPIPKHILNKHTKPGTPKVTFTYYPTPDLPSMVMKAIEGMPTK